MIIIKTSSIRAQKPFEYIIEGHAGYAESGRDIVCSGVSALHYAFIKWLEHAGIKYECTDDCSIVGVSLFDESARSCFEMVVAGFDGIAREYGNNVKIVYT